MSLGAQTLTLTNASSADTFSGSLNGTGGVSVTAGTAVLSAASAYTGATNISNGSTLKLTGSGSIAPSSGLANKGTFDITGMSGNVVLTGSGTAATYTQASTGTLKMLGAPGAFLTLTVAGAATLDGTLNEQVAAGTYTAGRYLVLSAGSVSGKFANLTSNIASYTNYHYAMSYDNADAYFIIGADPVSTLAQLGKFAGATSGLLSQGAANVASSLSYDCATFDKNGVCVGYQARYSTLDAINSGAAVLTAAMQLSSDLRIGTFIDANVAATLPAGMKVRDTIPTTGGFIGYRQNADGTGIQARVSASLNNAFGTLTRDATFANTEAGSGKARLSGRGVGGEFSYGFSIADKTIATPYLGLRRTAAIRGAYAETAIAGKVDLPVSYAAYGQRLTTATTGLRIDTSMTDDLTVPLALGSEYDLSTDLSHFSGTTAIGGLSSFDIVNSAAARRARLISEFGMSYALDKTQTLTAKVSARGQAYSDQTYINTLAGYQQAF